MKEIIVLDNDGVLVDSIGETIPMCFRIAQGMGLNLDEHFSVFLRSLWGKPLDHIFSSLRDHYGWTEAEKAEYSRRFRMNDDNHCPPLISGVVAAIIKMREKHTLCLLTNRNTREIGYAFSSKVLHPDWFELVQACDSGLPAKPDPRALLRIMQMAGGKRIVYIGDSAVDDWKLIQNAQEAYPTQEFSFFGVLTGMSTREQFLQAGLDDVNIFYDLRMATKAL